MANPWFRLWTDLANDPKWRTIARKSGQKIGDVIAVYVHMLTCGSNADDRGHIQGWCDEDVATALDIDTEQVEAIRDAMQGRVLDGDYLAGWEKRQPKREREDDNSTERSRQSRQRQKEPIEQPQHHATPCNTKVSQETPRLDEIRIEEIRQEDSKAETPAPVPVAPAAPKKSRSPSKTPLPNGFCISERVRSWAKEKSIEHLDRHFENFVSACRAKGYTYVDWDEGFMGAVRNDWAKLGSSQQARASPGHSGLSKAGQVTATNIQKWLEESDAT